MKILIALVPPAAFSVIPIAVSAGVAPAALNSALAQSGAKVAPPAKHSTDDKADKGEHQENFPEDSAR